MVSEFHTNQMINPLIPYFNKCAMPFSSLSKFQNAEF